MPTLEPGAKAPTFELPNAQKGPSLSSVPQSGQTTLIAFFKETCPTCQFAMPFVEKLYRHHTEDSNVRFLAVAQEDSEAAQRFLETYHLSLPTALDRKPYSVSQQYGLIYVPTLFLVREDQTIDQTAEGFVKKEYLTLADKLAKLTKKPAAPIFGGLQVPELKPG